MPCEQSIASAKAIFSSKVTEAIKTLMTRGYSHERAVNALARELNRGDPSARPSDQEIFETMRRYRIGSEDATKALLASKAMRRELESAQRAADAIDVLSKKISTSTLLYDSCDEESASPASPIRPELRVEPVMSTRKTTRKSRSSRSSFRSNTGGGRKRSIDELAPRPQDKKSTSSKETRKRADSVAEEVAEKISVETSNTDTPSSHRTPVVRGKRSLRSDETDSQSNVHKRMRISDAC